jgi:hypothetical protein
MFRGKPSSNHAVPTAATYGVDVSGLESYLVSSIGDDCMLRKSQNLSVLQVEAEEQNRTISRKLRRLVVPISLCAEYKKIRVEILFFIPSLCYHARLKPDGARARTHTHTHTHQKTKIVENILKYSVVIRLLICTHCCRYCSLNL